MARPALVFPCLLVLCGCATTGAPRSPAVLIGRAAPDFVARSLDDRSVSLASFRGRVVVLHIWACWCETCGNEMPVLDDVAGRLTSKGVEVLAVSIDSDRDTVRRFVVARPAWRLAMLQDPTGRVAELYQPAALPAAFVIDRGGTVRFVHVGFDHANMAALETEAAALAE